MTGERCHGATIFTGHDGADIRRVRPDDAWGEANVLTLCAGCRTTAANLGWRLVDAPAPMSPFARRAARRQLPAKALVA